MRVYNFSAGPSMLPLPVLERAAKEMTDYAGSGMSVMEMSHRSKVYQSIIDDAQARLRRVMQIPDDYEVLFMQGGASHYTGSGTKAIEDDILVDMLPYLEEYSANYYRIMMEDPTFCDILPGLKSEAS